ncbi:MAG: major capsid protein [Arizlama microvirus]|nr:MAG: major capsid protein [Arizlama microvirus]
MKMPSQKEHVFSKVPEANIPRSVFSRTHCYKTTFSAGKLIPFYCDEVLPGDTFSCKATLFARVLNTIAPIMDNLYLDYHFFYVPTRIVWANFKRFMGEQNVPTDSISFTVPQIVAPAGGWSAESIFDYMALPIGIAGISVNVLPLRCYNKIYQDWYKDENLNTASVIITGDGPDAVGSYNVLNRNKRHDYFTSALPWPLKGGVSVTIPLGVSAPVVTNGLDVKFKGATALTDFRVRPENGADIVHSEINGTGAIDWMRFGTESGLTTNLSGATAASINSLRQAFQLQKLLERDARGGTRYTEIVHAHFGVMSPDSRLQRPEYLGGGTSPISFNAVPQTSSTTGTYPQAHLAANGQAIGQSGFTKSFTEHGYIIGIMSARSDLTYQQGIPRMYSRLTKYDFYWPALACIGEQPILNKEIYAVATAAPGDAGDLQNLATFGYQEAFAEYRYFPSQITGKLRSTYATPLDVWHLAQNFTSLPTLAATFIAENPPMSRIKAVSTEPDFLFDSYLEIRAARPMPIYGVPGLIDHF